MRFAARTDLGGYGAGLPALARVAGLAIERPFVLLCGPNGSGKTALLRMVRATMGLMGERGGRIVAEEFARAPEVAACGGDPARMAAFVDGIGGLRLAKGLPGVLDPAALGWAGQRSHLYDSRSDGALASAATLGPDTGYHLSRIADGGTRASHGQFLGRGWGETIAWALGLDPARDPYDEAGLAPARRAAFAAACPGGARPEERWLFLDEPETALDAERLTAGLCALLGAAAPGRLRVFCASHAPAFPAGLADHPAVQVVDLGGDGAWFRVQRRDRRPRRAPAAGALGRRVAADMARQAEADRKAEARAASAAVTKALRGLGSAAGSLLDALYVRDGHRGGRADGLDGFGEARAWEPLERRGLVRLSGGMRHREGRLTPLGVEAGRRRAGRAPG